LATLAAGSLVVALAIGLFQGRFTESAAITIISERAGLVMNPDAKVKMRGVQVGKVDSISTRSDGTAEIQLAMDPSQLELIPANVRVDVTSSTVFGAKFVQLTPPVDPSAQTMRPGQVIAGEHVMVEVNTVFEQLTSVLSTIRPEQLNQTLSALSSAFSGRGREIGQSISDLNAALAELEPGFDNLRHDIAIAPIVLNTLADAAPDLLAIVDNASELSRTVIEHQHDLDALLVGVIGFADTGNDVLTANGGPLTDVLRLLAPVTGLTNQYNRALYCGLAGALPVAKLPPQQTPGALVMASLQWGMDPYRYPSDLPKVAATGGPQCTGLPLLPFETRAPYVVADVGTNPWEYGNQGMKLNTAAMKQWLLGQPVDGPPRNSAQIGMPG
jgi:phospholipid/cholesterol/gamma-HCH transport system substrate-binding protein